MLSNSTESLTIVDQNKPMVKCSIHSLNFDALLDACDVEQQVSFTPDQIHSFLQFILKRVKEIFHGSVNGIVRSSWHQLKASLCHAVNVTVGKLMTSRPPQVFTSYLMLSLLRFASICFDLLRFGKRDNCYEICSKYDFFFPRGETDPWVGSH